MIFLFKKLHNWLKARPKFIHLCWWFELYGLPIPPYFIAGGSTLDQRNWIIGADDNSDPDLCTFDIENVARINQPKFENFMLRFQIAEDGGGNASNVTVQLFMSTTDDPATATQVNTTSLVAWLDDGLVTDHDDTTENVMTGQAETWQNGKVIDTSDEVAKHTIIANNYSEYQFCLRFLATAQNETEHFFWAFIKGILIDGTYNSPTCSVTTAGIGGIQRTTAVTATGSADTTGYRTRNRISAITGSGTVATTGYRTRLRATAVAAIATVVTIGTLAGGGIERTTAVTATGTVTTIGQLIKERTTAVTASGSVATTGYRTRLRTTAVDASGSVATTGRLIKERTTAVIATGDVATTGYRTRLRTTAVGASGSVTTVGQLAGGPILGTTAVTASGSVATTGYRTRLRTTSVAASGSVATVGRLIIERTTAVSATASVASTGLRTRNRTTAVTGVGQVDTVGYRTRLRTTGVSAVASVITIGQLPAPVVTTEITATASVITTGITAKSKIYETFVDFAGPTSFKDQKTQSTFTDLTDADPPGG